MKICILFPLFLFTLVFSSCSKEIRYQTKESKDFKGKPIQKEENDPFFTENNLEKIEIDESAKNLTILNDYHTKPSINFICISTDPNYRYFALDLNTCQDEKNERILHYIYKDSSNVIKKSPLLKMGKYAYIPNKIISINDLFFSISFHKQDLNSLQSYKKDNYSQVDDLWLLVNKKTGRLFSLSQIHVKHIGEDLLFISHNRNEIIFMGSYKQSFLLTKSFKVIYDEKLDSFNLSNLDSEEKPIKSFTSNHEGTLLLRYKETDSDFFHKKDLISRTGKKIEIKREDFVWFGPNNEIFKIDKNLISANSLDKENLSERNIELNCKNNDCEDILSFLAERNDFVFEFNKRSDYNNTWIIEENLNEYQIFLFNERVILIQYSFQKESHQPKGIFLNSFKLLPRSILQYSAWDDKNKTLKALYLNSETKDEYFFDVNQTTSNIVYDTSTRSPFYFVDLNHSFDVHFFRSLKSIKL